MSEVARPYYDDMTIFAFASNDTDGLIAVTVPELEPPVERGELIEVHAEGKVYEARVQEIEPDYSNNGHIVTLIGKTEKEEYE